MEQDLRDWFAEDAIAIGFEEETRNVVIAKDERSDVL